MCMRASSLYVCACVVVGVYAWIEFICISECLLVYACVKFICIRKLFTSVYAFITNIRCIGMDFILVCTCISYIYFEHPIVYVSNMHVFYVSIDKRSLI